MSKYCADCKLLNTDKKKNDGLYYCNKVKDYVNTCGNSCSCFDLSYARKSFEKNQLFDEGKKAERVCNDNVPTEFYIGLAIIAAIIFTIVYLTSMFE